MADFFKTYSDMLEYDSKQIKLIVEYLKKIQKLEFQIASEEMQAAKQISEVRSFLGNWEAPPLWAGGFVVNSLTTELMQLNYERHPAVRAIDYRATEVLRININVLEPAYRALEFIERVTKTDWQKAQIILAEAEAVSSRANTEKPEVFLNSWRRVEQDVSRLVRLLRLEEKDAQSLLNIIPAINRIKQILNEIEIMLDEHEREWRIRARLIRHITPIRTVLGHAETGVRSILSNENIVAHLRSVSEGEIKIAF